MGNPAAMSDTADEETKRRREKGASGSSKRRKQEDDGDFEDDGIEDDECTLDDEEEEADNNEMDDLNAWAEMPIEELRAKYAAMAEAEEEEEDDEECEDEQVQSVTEDELDEAIKIATENKKRIFVCLFASFKEDDPEVRWCPDCVAAEPVIDEALVTSAAECHLIKVDITRNSWKVEPGPAHPYRSEPFQAGGIPTLLVLGADGAVEKRFGEEECCKLEVMKAIFQ